MYMGVYIHAVHQLGAPDRSRCHQVAIAAAPASGPSLVYTPIYINGHVSAERPFADLGGA